MMKSLSAACGLLLLSACGSTPPETLVAMSRFDPLTDDLSGLGARIEHPATIEIRPGDARIALAARRDDGETLSADLALTPHSQALSSGAGSEQILSEFALTEAALAEIEGFRNQVAAWEAAGHEVSGSVNVSVKGCGKAGRTDGPLPASVWLRLDPEAGYLLLRRDVDLRDLAAMAGDTPAGTCDEA